MIAVIDYGMGNLGSVKKAFDFIGVNSFVTSNCKDLKKANKIVVPGVGAFEDALNNLKKYEMYEAIIDEIKNKKPFLGICLGFQMLFNYSEEGNNPKGLGIIKGGVHKFPSDMGLKVPHMGWNNIYSSEDTKILREFNNEYFYFVHSFYTNPINNLPCAKTTYGIDYVSAIEMDNILACQFHPEKSGEVGLKLLKKWAGEKL